MKTSIFLGNLITSDLYDLKTMEVNASSDGYSYGEIVTFKDGKIDKSTLASGDSHTESYAVVYEAINSNDTKGVILTLGNVREELLSKAYQDLSDDDKNLVKAELFAKKIIIENI